MVQANQLNQIAEIRGIMGADLFFVFWYGSAMGGK
jgi:hypothetical protein